MREISYNREKVVDYARTWALGRNPSYLDFTNLGGDCTNFVSQCIFAGIGVMNYATMDGWYYIDGNRRAPAWTATRYLRRFLLGNRSQGPYATEVRQTEAQSGDVIQLMNPLGQYYHSMIILEAAVDEIYVAAHTNDAYMRPLSEYQFQLASFLRILGGRQ